MRAVLDTNVLIDALDDDFSAQAKLIDAARKQEITAIATSAIEREYRKILRRLIRDPNDKQRIEDFISQVEVVRPSTSDVVIDDEDDRKFVAAAIGGQANMIITNDRHLLDIGEVDQVRILTPTEAWNSIQEQQDGSSEWQQFAKGLGIGK